MIGWTVASGHASVDWLGALKLRPGLPASYSARRCDWPARALGRQGCRGLQHKANCSRGCTSIECEIRLRVGIKRIGYKAGLSAVRWDSRQTWPTRLSPLPLYSSRRAQILSTT